VMWVLTCTLWTPSIYQVAGSPCARLWPGHWGTKTSTACILIGLWSDNFFFLVLWIKPRTSHMLGKCSTIWSMKHPPYEGTSMCGNRNT
jgi:hypothetical protein